MENGPFLFIEETGTGFHKPATRSLIRTHVMDRVMSKMRSPPINRLHARHLEDQNDISSARLVSSVSLPESLTGVEDMAQLGGLPVDLHHMDTKFLLHHFLNTHSKTMCTIASETGWLKYALEDDTLFNSTIYYWAVINHPVLPSKFQRPEFLMKLKGLAITKISSRLTAAKGQVDNALVASVACLANVNLKIGKFDEAKLHFQGLIAMVRASNGIYTLGFDGLIARLLQATDSFHAQLSNTTLSIEGSTEPLEVEAVRSVPPPPLLTWAQEEENTQFDVLTRLRRIAADLVVSPKDLMSLEDQIHIGHRMLVSDREIISFIHSNEPSVSTVVAAAALLYSHAFLRAMNPSAPILKAAACNLKASLVHAYSLREEFFANNPRELLWVLIVGILASSSSTPEFSWFHFFLTKACEPEGRRVMAAIQATVSVGHPFLLPSYYWLLLGNWDKWLNISSINTRIL